MSKPTSSQTGGRSTVILLCLVVPPTLTFLRRDASFTSLYL